MYRSRETAYAAVLDIISNVSRDAKAEKQLSLAALHGQVEGRIAVPNSPISVFEKFDEAIRECIWSSGPDMWSVRVIFSITTEERLNTILERLERTEEADGYEVRAFALTEGIPHLSPVIVGDENLFLGLEDPRYYRVTQAIHVESRDAVRLGIEYFNSLWNDPRIFRLRSAVQINPDVVEQLRAMFEDRCK